jgi:uncharacterized protein (DUF433 family)
MKGVTKMPTLDWSQCLAVESPGRLSGAWVFRNTRMPVSAVFENLEAGATIDEIVKQFDILREQINEVLSLPPAGSTLQLQRRPAPSSMFILFDHVTPNGIARALVGHTVTKPKIAVGIRSAMVTCSPRPRRPVFDVFVTADKNMRYQQNLAGRRIALVVLGTPQWPV